LPIESITSVQAFITLMPFCLAIIDNSSFSAPGLKIILFGVKFIILL